MDEVRPRMDTRLHVCVVCWVRNSSQRERKSLSVLHTGKEGSGDS